VDRAASVKCEAAASGRSGRTRRVLEATADYYYWGLNNLEAAAREQRLGEAEKAVLNAFFGLGFTPMCRRKWLSGKHIQSVLGLVAGRPS
jgi:hypothetical protein